MNFYNPRATVFGRNAVKLEARPGEALDIDFIRAHAPALFAEVPHSSRSERFAHIPTHQMIDALSKEGWAVTGVRVGGSSDAEKRSFTKHMLRLRRKDQLQPRALNETLPEVVLKNGHDGTSQYHLMMGLFRLICMNGMVVSDSMFGDIKVPHRGQALDKVIEVVSQRSQPIIIGAPYASGGNYILKVAVRAGTWTAADLEARMIADQKSGMGFTGANISIVVGETI
jgi:hypothetical protein